MQVIILAVLAAVTAASYDDTVDYHSVPDYSYGYATSDPYSGVDNTAQENRLGDRTEGSYSTLLPDGRRQIVTYWVDGDSGYNAKVTYEGVAHHPATPVKSSSYGGGSIGGSIGAVGGHIGPVGGHIGAVGGHIGAVGSHIGAVGGHIGAVGGHIGAVGAARGAVGGSRGRQIIYAGTYGNTGSEYRVPYYGQGSYGYGGPYYGGVDFDDQDDFFEPQEYYGYGGISLGYPGYGY